MINLDPLDPGLYMPNLDDERAWSIEELSKWTYLKIEDYYYN